MMPVLGEVRKGSEIGQKSLYTKFIWLACEGCGKERWVLLDRGSGRNSLCFKCSMKTREN